MDSEAEPSFSPPTTSSTNQSSPSSVASLHETTTATAEARRPNVEATAAYMALQRAAPFVESQSIASVVPLSMLTPYEPLRSVTSSHRNVARLADCLTLREPLFSRWVLSACICTIAPIASSTARTVPDVR
eukprot:7390630-Prymnesium_polylepis.2